MSPPPAQLYFPTSMACPVVGLLLIAGIIACAAELRRYDGGTAPFFDRRKALLTGVIACSIFFALWLAVVVHILFFAPRIPDLPEPWPGETSTTTRRVYAP